MQYSTACWPGKIYILSQVSTMELKQYEALIRPHIYIHTARITHQSPDRACVVARPSSADCYGRWPAAGSVSSRPRHVADRGSSACCFQRQNAAISTTTNNTRISECLPHQHAQHAQHKGRTPEPSEYVEQHHGHNQRTAQVLKFHAGVLTGVRSGETADPPGTCCCVGAGVNKPNLQSTRRVLLVC